jgi:hypothetical protein
MFISARQVGRGQASFLAYSGPSHLALQNDICARGRGCCTAKVDSWSKISADGKACCRVVPARGRPARVAVRQGERGLFEKVAPICYAIP